MTSGFKSGLIAAAALASAAVCASGPAAAADVRPSPTLFKGGTCLTDACARDRWLEFLGSRGFKELELTEDTIRLIEWKSEPCDEDAPRKDGVRIAQTELNTAFNTEVYCGKRLGAWLPGHAKAPAFKELSKAEIASLDGDYPAYCKEGDDQDVDEIQATVLEVVKNGRYRLIEWDCEMPAALGDLMRILDLKPVQ